MLQQRLNSFNHVTMSLSPASSISGSNLAMERKANILNMEESKERIRKMFDKVELSISAYDTAWVAMVQRADSPQAPCFPQCVNWLLENQHQDGSWGIQHSHPLLKQDSLSSTMACVIALKRWGIGERQINKGLEFIELNFDCVNDKKQHKPIGFDIIFPGLIEYAKELNLNLPLAPSDIEAMLLRRSLELESGNEGSSDGRKAFLAYVSEGMGKLQDWEAVMKYQRKNGSLFNSPSTTAAAFCQLENADCLHYLFSLVNKFGNAVPTIHPFDTYARLCLVDNLESLGIERYFRKEIRSVLDETYRCWLEADEEIFSDVKTCAMAFRILRLNGYNVSTDPLSQLAKEEYFLSSLEGYQKDIGAALELFKASQIIVRPDESALDNQNSWTSRFMKMELQNGLVFADETNNSIGKKVDFALEIPYCASLDRLAHRKNIELYNADNTRLSKTLYRSCNINGMDILRLAVDDFNICQSMHREELELLERWVVDQQLDKLKFARQKMAYCYFSVAATLFSPELSDARISWAKNAVLTTVVDDFFDVGGSEKELANLIQLVEKWGLEGGECCSEHVEIIFSALHSTISEIADKALKWQGRDVTSHIVETWLNLLKSMRQEAEWSINKSVPTVEEYMRNAYVSFALGPIVLPAIYLVGPKLTHNIVISSEFNDLYKLMSTCGRLLNDIQSFKRESAEGKLNVLSLHLIHGKSSISEEEAIKKMRNSISDTRKEVLRLVLQEKDSIVPKPCKDLFWKMTQIVHLFYMKDDGFTSQQMHGAVNAVIHNPLGPLQFQS